MKKEIEFNLRKKRRELFEKELVGRPNAGRIYRKIIAQDKQFLKEVLDEIDKSINTIKNKLDKPLPELTQANLSGGLIYLKELKQIIKQKAGDKLR